MLIDLKECRNELCRRHLIDFAQRMMPSFEVTNFNTTYYEILTRFARGEIKRLIITMPPQHGKSQGSTRFLPAFLLGINPNLKIAIASYNQSFARKFNRDVQRIIDTREYNDIFPKTTLNRSNIVTVSSSFLRNSDEFEIVNHRGGVKVVGRGGALTGNQVDIMVMDDLYKDYAEGNSPVVRDAVWDWYTTVVRTRLHNNSQELIVFTRWHEEDLIGKLEESKLVCTINSLDDIDDIDPNLFIKINFEAIKESEKTEFDARDKGEPLWPSKHSIRSLNEKRALDPEQFNCLYQGDPQSSEGMLYSKFKTYKERSQYVAVYGYVDTADQGNDYLCSVVYGVTSIGEIQILDIYYSQDAMEVTEPIVAGQMIHNSVNVCFIESNNGGRGFARNIERMAGHRVNIEWFTQTGNKESRIISNSATVNRLVYFPEDWAVQWPVIYKHLNNFKRLFKANKNDDIEDVLTGMVEKLLEMTQMDDNFII